MVAKQRAFVYCIKCTPWRLMGCVANPLGPVVCIRTRVLTCWQQPGEFCAQEFCWDSQTERERYMYEFSFGGGAHHYAKRIADSAKGFLLNHSFLRAKRLGARHVRLGGNSWPYFTRVVRSQLIAGQSSWFVRFSRMASQSTNSLLLLRLTAANPFRPRPGESRHARVVFSERRLLAGCPLRVYVTNGIWCRGKYYAEVLDFLLLTLISSRKEDYDTHSLIFVENREMNFLSIKCEFNFWDETLNCC